MEAKWTLLLRNAVLGGICKYGSWEVVYTYCFYRNINQSLIFNQIARVPRFHIMRYSCG
jgi:hypothetical protein